MKPVGQNFLFPLFTSCLHSHTISICKSQATKSEFQPQPDSLRHDPDGYSGLAPGHGPRGGRNLSQFQNTMTLSSPFRLHIPLAGHPSCTEGTTAGGEEQQN